jgi:site-specific DNA-methyltransferase (adenine-specific)
MDKRAPGLKPKDLCMIPAHVAMALRDDGWWLRDCIIWHKPNPMPESVTDRTTRAHEFIFLLSKSARYFYDQEAIRERQVAPEASTPEDLRRAHNSRREQTPNPRQDRIPSGWETEGGNHRDKKGRYAKARDPKKRRTGKHSVRPGVDTKGGKQGRGEDMQPENGLRNKRSVWTIPTQPYPVAGSGTTLLVAIDHQRSAIGIELSSEYAEMARQRLRERNPLFAKEIP